MAATKAKHPASRQPRDTHPSPGHLSSPKIVKSKKGKSKEEDATSVAQKGKGRKEPDELTEHITWSWTSLTDSWVSRQPPVFTKDGSYFFSIVGSSVKIYSSTTGQVVSTLSASPSGSSASKFSQGNGHTDSITAAVLSPTNPFQLITASLDGCIKVWDFLEADLLQTIDLAQPILHLCAHQNFKDHVFVSVARPGSSKEDNNAVLRVSLKPSAATAGSAYQKSSEILAVGKTRSTCGLAVSPSGQWLVAAAGHKAYVAQTSALKSGFTKFVSPEALTCLAFHPSEEYFATGDVKGHIRLWYCLNEEIIRSHSAVGVEKKAQTTTLHWHAHAVSGLAFTVNGAYLLSGGEESVLVIWQLHTGKKEFIPRVGSPILSIAVCRARDREEEYILGLADASFAVIDAGSLKIMRSFSRIKLDSTAPLGKHLTSFPVPLAYHGPTSSLVLPSSHPSSLQTYSPTQHKLLSELEVSPSNRVSRRDEKSLEPSRVLRVAVASSGEWMATLDSREGDDTFHREIYLKLWQWNARAGIWSLNTRIDRPHGDKQVSTVVFHPDRRRPLIVTTGEDGKVRGWGIRTTVDKNGGQEDFWVARSALDFRSEVPTHASWSPDGSLLLVSFGSHVVLCDSITGVINTALTSPQCKSARSAHFVGTEGRYVAVVGSHDIVLWDLISQTVRWHRRCSIAISAVVPHPLDDSVAVFYSSWGADLVTTVEVLSTSSERPIRKRSLPFHLLTVSPYPVHHVSSSHKSLYALVAITSSWNVVLLGDYVAAGDEQASCAQVIPDPAGSARRPTLFQDIFGKSAFADTSNPRSEQIPATSSYSWDSKDAAAVLDGPAHLIPPIESVFDSLMGSFLKPRLPCSQEAAHIADESDEGMDEDVDVDMDVTQDTAPVVISRSSERVVSVEEMDMFVELFKQHAINGHRPNISQVNGKKTNGTQVHPNGYTPRHPVPAQTNGYHQLSPQSVLSTPAKSLKNGVLHQHSGSPVAPLTAGKKRKKSLG
ncbi:WD40 repeat-like protein [Gloeophyllum trabeum ATCC 11539]|uniref:WD40 repeat-like protein n=1 Tax=Gloeophyllum trabeum (strain ATCC 11539 / FP-39264 / Madison 617) TaxID=670483 RepID=S7QKT7_GLOTA|nr:WD40 repeat-like protein [Gloeophyllum trabeum ATCC 11539]EPQ60436.1 WD40 repeat-like protein [Gloeophyllum trabeum ATCC 11539]